MLEGTGRDGYRGHSRQDRAGLYANAGWRATPALDLRVFATYLDSEEELAGGLSRAQFDADRFQPNPSAISGHYQLNVRTSRLAARGSWSPATDRRLDFGLSREGQHLYHPIVDKVMVDFDGPGPAPPVEVFSLLKTTDQRTLAGMVRYSARIGEHDVLAGINLADTREQGGDHRNAGGMRNGQTGIIDNRSDSVELFVVDRWAIAPDWTMVYGAQGVLTGRDVRSTDLATGTVRNPRRDYTAFNPRVGVIHALGAGSEAFASASRLYEAPTVFELEDDVRGDGATLDAMHGAVLEVGVRGETALSLDAARWHWDVSLYYARIRDEILSVDDPAAPGTSLSSNVDRTVHAGLEALLGASFAIGNGTHRIEPLLSATWNAFSFDGDRFHGDNTLPAAPDYAIRGELVYRHRGGLFAGPTFDLVGSRYADFANSYRVGGYALLGLRTGIERERWQLFAEARNLLDRKYVGSFSVRDRARLDDAILQAGEPRSVYVGMRYLF
ncbi:TonB-dependent receptor domain-containing protein [Luteimonas sp. A611]